MAGTMKHLLKNKLALSGIIILGVMFLFSFLGSAISPYGETEVFRTTETALKDYAVVTVNKNFNSYNADTELSYEFQYQAEAALNKNNESFQADGTTYYVIKDSENVIIRKYKEVSVNSLFETPSLKHPLGTDGNGMDVLTRLMYGGRISLIIGFVVVFIEIFSGILVGGVSGYFGKWPDNLIMRFVDVINCIPAMPLYIIGGSILDYYKLDGRIRIYILCIILGLLSWPTVARMVRGQILALREQEFMIAAKATGIKARHRIFRHLIPNVIPQLIVIATMDLGNIILAEATLSFLGLGVKYPYASWGNIINSVNDIYIMTNYWFVWVPDGILILLTVLAFNFIGDGLKDTFDGLKSFPKYKSNQEYPYITEMKNCKNVVEFEDLHTYFFTDNKTVKAVNGVSFDIPTGKIVGIVGESGCGKSVTSLSLMQLIQHSHGKIVQGQIRFNTGDNVIDVVKAPSDVMQKLRGNQISMIFQEPVTSLNPVLRVGHQIDEVLIQHCPKLGRNAVKKRTLEILELVGIGDKEGVYKRYPHELSGGMCQRIVIAMGLACNPKLIIADEPTTALDVTIQAQILDLLRALKEKRKSSIMLITHDLAVIAEMADYVVVMRDGSVVEKGTVHEIFNHPKHPYTRKLMNAKTPVGKESVLNGTYHEK